jgi:hypothetical protein
MNDETLTAVQNQGTSQESFTVIISMGLKTLDVVSW